MRYAIIIFLWNDTKVRDQYSGYLLTGIEDDSVNMTIITTARNRIFKNKFLPNFTNQLNA